MTGNPAILKSIKEADLQWSYHGRSTPVDSFRGTGMSHSHTRKSLIWIYPGGLDIVGQYLKIKNMAWQFPLE